MNVQRIPRYRQLKEGILRQISAGTLRPRDRVPSENELVESAGVSRMTANRALRELTDEGYLERVAGIGTFVADLKAASHVLEVRNIADEVRHRGHVHSARVLGLDEIAADEKLAESLHVRKASKLYRANVVHFESGTPVQIEERYVVPDFAPEFLQQDFSKVTPSAYLSAISPLQEADQVVRAEMPDRATRRRLEMDDSEPCLVVNRRTWSRGRPVSFARLRHPGSRFELSGHYIPPGTEAIRHQWSLEQ